MSWRMIFIARLMTEKSNMPLEAYFLEKHKIDLVSFVKSVLIHKAGRASLPPCELALITRSTRFYATVRPLWQGAIDSISSGVSFIHFHLDFFHNDVRWFEGTQWIIEKFTYVWFWVDFIFSTYVGWTYFFIHNT